MTFYDPSTLPWIGEIADNYKSIRAEFELLQDEVLMEMDSDDIYDSGWDVFGLHYRGTAMLDNCDVCPITTSLIRGIPGMLSAGFDILRPETAISEPECATNEYRLSLGLIVPTGTAIVVDGIISPWIEGGVMVWDRSLDSEAINSSPKITRVSLVVDFKTGKNLVPLSPLPL
tara:strand:- start:1000 stop:1518 length:519 start_codon:yes stop_codon:yes gene_type:complete